MIYQCLFVNDLSFRRMMSLSNGKYRVIKPPMDIDVSEYPEFRLGRSEKGVYFALLDRRHWLRVWMLNESCGRMEWVSKHQSNLEPILPRQNYNQQVHRPWIMEDINCDFDRPRFPNNNKEALVECYRH